MTDKCPVGTKDNKTQARLGSFTNTNGETFQIRGLSPMVIDQIRTDIKADWDRQGKPWPVCPTYTIPASEANEEEVHDHNATTLLVKDDLAQTKTNEAVWEKYTRQLEEIESENSKRLMKKVFLAVDCHPDDAWRDEMEFGGTTLPAKGSGAEKYLYVSQRVIQSFDDVAKLLTSVLGLAGIIKAEAVEAAEAAFQSLMEQATTQGSESEG